MELSAGYHNASESAHVAAIGPEVVDELRAALSAAINSTNGTPAELDDLVSALVERVRDLQWTPQKCIIALKQILRDQRILPGHQFPSTHLGRADRAAVVYERAVLICIKAYFRDRPSL